MIIADTLNRAFSPSTDGVALFHADIALFEAEFEEELRMVASERTIKSLKNAARDDQISYYVNTSSRNGLTVAQMCVLRYAHTSRLLMS